MSRNNTIAVARKAALALVVLLALAACGGGGGTKASSGAAPSSDASGGAGAATTVASKALDVCSLITKERFNEAVGRQLEKERISSVGGGPSTDCDYSTDANGTAGTVNYLDDDYGQEVFKSEHKNAMDGAVVCDNTYRPPCYRDIAGLGTSAFEAVKTMDGSPDDVTVSLVVNRGDVTLTMSADMPTLTSGDHVLTSTVVAGLTSLAKLVFK